MSVTGLMERARRRTEAPKPMIAELDGAALRRAGKELVPAALVAALASVALQLLVEALPIPPGSEVPNAYAGFAIAATAALLILLVARNRWPRWANPVAWAGSGAIGTFWLSFALAGSQFYLGGVSWDQTPRVQYLARMAESASLTDLNYADLPPFYPAGWFWLGGRLADLFGVPGFAAYKPYAIATVAVAAAVIFVLWSVVVPRRIALLLAVATTMVAIRGAAYEPYSWLVLAVIPPLAMIAWALFRDAGRLPRGTVVAAVLLLGLFLGLSAAVYTLAFAFFCFLLAIFTLAALFAGRRAGQPFGPMVRRLVARVLGIGLTALPLTLLLWAPYLLAIVDTPVSGSTALRYLPNVGALLPTPMFRASAAGAVCLLGTVWLLFAWRRSQVARALAAVALTCYAWYAVSTVALLVPLTLLPFRVEPLLEVTLWCAGTLAALDLLRLALARFGHVFDSVPWPRPSRTAQRNVVAGTLAVLLLVTVAQQVRSDDQSLVPGYLDAAAEDYGLDGTNALADPDPADDGYWAGALTETVESMTGKEPTDITLLTTFNDLLALRPYHGFQTTISGWANPLADYLGRNEQIDAWAASPDPAAFRQALDDSEFRAPEAFVLRRTEEGYSLRVSFDIFPREPNIGYREVVFDDALFDDPAFVKRDVGPFTVITRVS